MLKSAKSIQQIKKESEQVKFKIHQCIEDLKDLREKRNDLEIKQSKETLHTPMEETISRAQELKKIKDEIEKAELQMNQYIDEQYSLENEVLEIIEQEKAKRDQEIKSFNKECERIERLSIQLQDGLNKLAEHRSLIFNHNNRIDSIAKSALNPSNAKEVIQQEKDFNCINQADKIRKMLVKVAGSGITSIR